jgi:guanylate cyclase
MGMDKDSYAGPGSLTRITGPFFRGSFKRIGEIGINPGDGQDIRLAKSLYTIASLLVIPAALIWGLAYVIFGETLAGIISLSFSALSVIMLVTFAYTQIYRPFLFLQLSLGMIIPFIQTVLLGGMMNSSALILWSMISPVGILLLFGIRKAAVWWAVFLFLVVLSGILQPAVQQSSPLPEPVVIMFLILNILAVSTITFVVLVSFLRQKEEILERLKVEEAKAESLLLNILPKDIAARLKDGNRTIANAYPGASILFADLVGFTRLTAELEPAEMVSLLNEVFSYFDSLVEKFGVEKIRTIGDNYMVGSGVPRQRKDHAQALARMALDITNYLQSYTGVEGKRIEFRIGINSGPVIGGVIGRQKFVYDLWGDAVNIASRMESQGVPGKIQISQNTYDLIKDQFICEPRGLITVKGRGQMATWYLIAERQAVRIAARAEL